MSAPMRIALDAMGGDHAPRMVLECAGIALKRFPDTRFLIFGNEQSVRPLLDNLPAVAGASEFRHTPDAVAGDAKPTVALRTGRNSSMRLAINAVRATLL